MSLLPPSHPVLDCGAARALETGLFGDDEGKEWAAMERAGSAVGAAVLRDFEEIGGFPKGGALLVLVGKGHNGGDALLAAKTILAVCPHARADVRLVFGDAALRPLTKRALQILVHSASARLRFLLAGNETAQAYDLLLDGVFGFQFRPPVASVEVALFDRVNAGRFRLRAAVDLPSGLGDPAALRADFTYATGSVKSPVADEALHTVVGRWRYLDLGFFAPSAPRGAGEPEPARVLGTDVLAPLRELRTAKSDKRTYGHVFLLGGSRDYPGAIMMSALAATRSGAGLVTAFVPETLAPTYAAQLPEVMWVGWPETPQGSLALEGVHLFFERIERATSLLIGPGLGREPETQALVTDVLKRTTLPVVIDADALQKSIVSARRGPGVLTPHAGEFARVSDGALLPAFSAAHGFTTVLKGPVTRISDGGAVYHSPFGGPVLARGGSGDLLAGLTAGLLAQTPNEPLLAACRAVVWHGVAADHLARAQGQVAVRTTQLLDYLPAALRGAES